MRKQRRDVARDVVDDLALRDPGCSGRPTPPGGPGGRGEQGARGERRGQHPLGPGEAAAEKVDIDLANVEKANLVPEI